MDTYLPFLSSENTEVAENSLIHVGPRRVQHMTLTKDWCGCVIANEEKLLNFH